MLFKGAMDFIYNGWNSRLDKYIMVQIGNDEETPLFGLNQDIEFIEGNQDVNIVKKIKNNYVDMNITIAKTDGKGNLVSMTKEDEFELRRLFFSVNDFRPFIVNGIEYMMKVINAENHITYNNHTLGYIVLKCKFHPTAYQRVSNIYRVKSSKNIEITNKTSVYGNCYPTITIRLNSGNSIKFTNTVNGKVMELTGLETNVEYEINTYQRQIINKSNSSKDMFSSNKGEWLSLNFGINRYKIECVDGNVKIEYKIKIAY